MIIRRAKYLGGEVRLPADKSISHRAAMIAAIAEGESRIENYATSADCASTLSCLRQLGVKIRQEGTSVSIDGAGRLGLDPPHEPLDCGNSGTTMRLLAGILAGQKFDSVLTGDDSLQRRPMRRIADPLNAMGAAVETSEGHAPVKIFGNRTLRGIEHDLKVASAQVKSCILLAGLNADGDTCVTEPTLTRDHTERMLRFFKAEIASAGADKRHRIRGGVDLVPGKLEVPADISAAAFFLVGAACLPGSELTMKGVGVNPTRVSIALVLQRLGAQLRSRDRAEWGYEPMADIIITGGFDHLESNETLVLKGEMIPGLIDELPIIAVLGSQHPNGIEVRDASELRVKESDRISAIIENLRRMNADVKEFDDGFRVEQSRLTGARVDSFGDHRIAMAFAIAGLMADGETEIEGAECASVSFPDFFEQLENVAVYQ